MDQEACSEGEYEVNENDFDTILDRLGRNGHYFIRSKIFMFILVTVAAMNLGAPAFIDQSPAYECQLPEQLLNYLPEKCNLSSSELNEAKNRSCPMKNGQVSKCHSYSLESLMRVNCSYWKEKGNVTVYQNNFQVVDCKSWIFDTSTYKSTIFTTFQLTCDKTWQLSLSKYAMLFGIFFGAFIAGHASDSYGRRPVFLLMIGMITTSTILSVFVPSFYFYSAMRFLVGFGVIGACETGYVYLMETTVAHQRIVTGQVMQTTFSVAFMLLAFVAYMERTWQNLMLYISALLVICGVPFFFLSGESPRWLLSMGKLGRTRKVLEAIAKANKKSVDFDNVKFLPLHKSASDEPKLMVQEKDALDDDVTDSGDVSTSSGECNKNSKERMRPKTRDIFQRKIMRNMTLILCYSWFACTCIYYGLTLNVTSLVGDPYVNFFLNGLVEIPANMGAIWLIAKYGRRFTISAANTLSGISLISMLFVPEGYNVVKLNLYLLGKFGTSATFSCIYLYTSELFPTLLRGNGIGICSSCARIGGVVSQSINNLAAFETSLPYVIYGVIALLAALLILCLPETNGTTLPDSIEDTECLYRKRRMDILSKLKYNQVTARTPLSQQ